MVVHGPYPVGEVRVEREAHAARNAGWSVDVLAMRRNGERSQENAEGVNVRRLPLQHRRGVSLVAALGEYLAFTALAAKEVARARRYDIIQVHSPPDFLIIAALLPQRRGARVILDVHDLSSDMFAMRFGEKSWARAADRILRLVEQLAAGAADAVITVHDPYRAELERRGVPAEKLTVVLNSVDESHLPALRDVDTNANDFRVVYHGTITAHYGLELLVTAAARAAQQIPTLTLELYGDGDRFREVRALASKLHFADRLQADGRFLPHREVLKRVSGASVGVVPNRPIRLNRFALSSKLFEYVALGVPVIAADLPTLRSHFSDDEVRFFQAGDESALTQALIEVATEPEAAQRRATAAQASYETYRWHEQARRYAELLDRLASA
jgi:glycosyltransferase involved in cell wall biosynthesis